LRVSVGSNPTPSAPATRFTVRMRVPGRQRPQSSSRVRRRPSKVIAAVSTSDGRTPRITTVTLNGGGRATAVGAGVGPIGTVDLLGCYVLAEADSTDPSAPTPVALIALDPTRRLAGQLPQFLGHGL